MVIEQLTHDWAAYSKWNLQYIKEIAGDKIVPLYDDRPVSYKDGFNEAHAKMKMARLYRFTFIKTNQLQNISL